MGGRRTCWWSGLRIYFHQPVVSFAVLELGKKMNFRPVCGANLQEARGLLLYLSAGLQQWRGTWGLNGTAQLIT